jgi:adenylyltransferase/sulfurtransferase
MATPPVTPGDERRYHRQRILPVVGEAGMQALRSSHAFVVGVGALGCQIADLLARAGTGTLTLVDRDVVEWTNLQRQCLFDEDDAACSRPKVEAASRRLHAVNSGVRVRAIAADFCARNASKLFAEAAAERPVGVLLDGTDNFETRYLLNDLSVHLGVPYVYGGAIGTRAMAATFNAGADAPCLRCVFPEPPAPGSQPTCDTAGVLGPAVSLAASWQAAMAMRCLMGAPAGEFVLHDVDVWQGSSRAMRMRRAPDCPCCGAARRRDFLECIHEGRTTLCGSDAVQVWPRPGLETTIDLHGLASRLAGAGRVQASAMMVRFTPAEGGVEMSLFADGRAIVRGTRDEAKARAAYAKYVGV